MLAVFSKVVPSIFEAKFLNHNVVATHIDKGSVIVLKDTWAHIWLYTSHESTRLKPTLLTSVVHRSSVQFLFQTQQESLRFHSGLWFQKSATPQS